MKSTIKILGIVTLAVAIGIAMTACPSDGSGDSTVAVTGVNLEMKWIVPLPSF